ncbi:hypothetical protein K437DRAFT_164539 [Tilletiaria anomala UBC 951]|uniref:Uncharacterized protein n=1 Tax=Tilletiaria anomala (strain ATCC 24038 / CBS 436.72 / UBC 951) TaxID=1037660 RepID=A0A066VL18_TILAU|nr:uncharacterized protein K437DRAFT_164539 [Tilletiaria anomala UBC 951]KDN42407.1 hypothetical protein K437DRAFT_164539 [Tilletiaria anomala UBC 951]
MVVLLLSIALCGLSPCLVVLLAGSLLLTFSVPALPLCALNLGAMELISNVCSAVPYVLANCLLVGVAPVGNVEANTPFVNDVTRLGCQDEQDILLSFGKAESVSLALAFLFRFVDGRF